MCSYMSALTFSIGLQDLVYLGSQIYAGLRGLTKYCLLPRRNLKERYGGGWALVTGASDGLGKQYSFELARSGFNIILMARSSQKTEAVA